MPLVGRTPTGNEHEVFSKYEFHFKVGKENLASKNFRLPPEIKDITGTGHCVGDWLADYFRGKLDVAHEVKALHAFRHTFKTQARLAGIPKDVADIINGHSSGDVSGSYGEYPLSMLKEALDKIPSVPVNLSEIHWKLEYC
jgi:integrase